MIDFFSNLFGFGTSRRRQRILKRYAKVVRDINNIEEVFKQLSDEELQNKTKEYKDRLEKGESLESLLVEAFATVREASWRVLGMRHFDVQLLGGLALHYGNIAEMKTGEGKTLVATLPTYLNALLDGRNVYVVTVNDYLAKRDSEWMQKLFIFLGMSVGLLQSGMNFSERSEAYVCDIIYGTNNEFGFDYLRDNIASQPSMRCQSKQCYAIIDEVDSILIDEARTPLIISGPMQDSEERYQGVAEKVRFLEKDVDFTIELRQKNIILTDEGIDKLEKELEVDHLYSIENMSLAHISVQCLKALHLFKKDVDYVVNDDKEVVIVDEFTGRLMEGRRYSDGLHQAIEAMEGVPIQDENQTLASITFQNYFRMFDKLAGMTGTAVTEEEEFFNIYNLSVVVIPTNKVIARKDLPDVVYKSKDEKYKAIVQDVIDHHEKGVPVLVGTISINTSELLSEHLSKKNINHKVLNAKYHQEEAEIISHAGKQSSVTIATNMAGRGTDIVLDHGVKELGGLYVIGTERHESRRIDNQLRGRSGRQGDPGKSRFYVSLEDDLMKMFGSERISKVMETLGIPSDTPVEHSLVTRAIGKAQRKVERYHFGVRKQILQYDDVLSKQRETIYSMRNLLMDHETVTDSIFSMLETLVEGYAFKLKSIPHEEVTDEVLKEVLVEPLEHLFFTEGLFSYIEYSKKGLDTKNLLTRLNDVYLEKRSDNGDKIFDITVVVPASLMTLDRKWVDHLYAMDVLRDGIGLRALGNKDPLVEYKKEAFILFKELLFSIAEETLETLFKMSLAFEVEDENSLEIGEVSSDEDEIDDDETFLEV